MGTRYWITVICPKCSVTHTDVWYAPTCGFKEFTCLDCGFVVDLAEYMGISEEEASNRAEIEALIEAIERGQLMKQDWLQGILPGFEDLVWEQLILPGFEEIMEEVDV